MKKTNEHKALSNLSTLQLLLVMVIIISPMILFAFAAGCMIEYNVNSTFSHKAVLGLFIGVSYHELCKYLSRMIRKGYSWLENKQLDKE